ncbi:MAG: methyltransferase domain-containing protein [Steroidobacteraceae bacterium]
MNSSNAVAATGSKHGNGDLAAIADLLACPACRGPLAIETDSIHCPRCSSRFAMRDGVPLLAIAGTSETWDKPQDLEQSAGYQAEYQRVERAAAYNLEYQRQVLKRSSTRREFRLIGRHMRRLGRSGIILDLPCGGGRLTPAFADAAERIIEADIGLGQVLYGRIASNVATPRTWMTASAFHIPLSNNAVDGTICVRLSHHLPTAAERERLLQELLRVSRRFVIVTYFDHHSLKNIFRRLRRPFNRKEPKMTMTTARVAEIARKNGAHLVAAPPLSRIGSGHRYALILKERDRAS